jgi:hypothetical protein
MQIICPACGLLASYQPDDDHELVDCAGCGKQNRVPKTIPIERGEAGEPASVKNVRRRRVVWAAGLSVIVVMSSAIGAWQLLRPPASAQISFAAPVPSQQQQPWDQLHRQELVMLKAQADALAGQGQWQAAYDGYQQILSLMADHDVRDPVALATISSAQVNQDRMVQAIGEQNINARQASREAAASKPVLVNAAEVTPVVHPTIAVPDAPLASLPANVIHEQSQQRVVPSKLTPERLQAPSKVAENPAMPAVLVRRPSPDDAGDSSSSLGGNSRTLSGDSGLTGSSDTNLSDNQQLQSTMLDQQQNNPDPHVIVRRVPYGGTSPAGLGGQGGVGGSASATVTVTLEAHAAGSPPVTGTVDGKSFSLGGPGEPSSITFTGLGPEVPVTLDGQHYVLTESNTSVRILTPIGGYLVNPAPVGPSRPAPTANSGPPARSSAAVPGSSTPTIIPITKKPSR